MNEDTPLWLVSETIPYILIEGNWQKHGYQHPDYFIGDINAEIYTLEKRGYDGDDFMARAWAKVRDNQRAFDCLYNYHNDWLDQADGGISMVDIPEEWYSIAADIYTELMEEE